MPFFFSESTKFLFTLVMPLFLAMSASTAQPSAGPSAVSTSGWIAGQPARLKTPALLQRLTRTQTRPCVARQDTFVAVGPLDNVQVLIERTQDQLYDRGRRITGFDQLLCLELRLVSTTWSRNKTTTTRLLTKGIDAIVADADSPDDSVFLQFQQGFVGT